MSNIQDRWREGYLDGWAEQGVLPTTEPTIPPLPNVPSGIADPDKWAYEEGRKRGVTDRAKSQAGRA